jgi:hypothetical protein
MFKQSNLSSTTAINLNANDPFSLKVTSMRTLTDEDTLRVSGGDAATSSECTSTCPSNHTCTKGGDSDNNG